MCNVLPVILRANYDDPVDSAKDIIDRNLTLFSLAWSDMWKQWLAGHDNPHYRTIAETMIVPTFYEYFDLLHGVVKNDTHVFMAGYLGPGEKSLGLWWKSKEVVEGFQGFGGYLTKKQWKHYEVVELTKKNSLLTFYF